MSLIKNKATCICSADWEERIGVACCQWGQLQGKGRGKDHKKGQEQARPDLAGFTNFYQAARFLFLAALRKSSPLSRAQNNMYKIRRTC